MFSRRRMQSVIAMFAMGLPGCCDGRLGDCPLVGCDASEESCRIECDDADPACAGVTAEEHAGFDEALLQWRQRVAAMDEPCDVLFPVLAVVECPAEGRTILYERGGFTSRALIYDAATGAFIGYRTASDVIDCACRGRMYWPALTSCVGATATEVLCGTAVSVGDELSFP